MTITSFDRKISLLKARAPILHLSYINKTLMKTTPEDIANAKGMDRTTFIKELETIVSGTKIDISYEVDALFDEDQQES